MGRASGGTELAACFERHRGRLRAVAFRVLGTYAEADDAVRAAWLRLEHAGPVPPGALPRRLTAEVARVCLAALRAREGQSEGPETEAAGRGDPRPAGGARGPGAVPAWGPGGTDTDEQARLADSVGRALLVVLDTLAPEERLAYVLHDMFAVPCEDIAPMVGCDPPEARRLADGARRRVRAAGVPLVDAARSREVVESFHTAVRRGDRGALRGLLDPDVVLRPDGAAVLAGACGAVGAAEVAGRVMGRAGAARPWLVDGLPGLVWSRGGRPRAVFVITVVDGRVTVIDMVADPRRIGHLALEPPVGPG